MELDLCEVNIVVNKRALGTPSSTVAAVVGVMPMPTSGIKSCTATAQTNG